MRDDQRPDRQQPDPSQPRHADDVAGRFDEALDDLFGPAERNPERAPYPATSEPVTPEPTSGVQDLVDVLGRRAGHLGGDRTASPGPPLPAGGRFDQPAPAAGRPWRRIACIGCAAFVGIPTLCLVALIAFSLAVDVDTNSSERDAQPVVDTQPSVYGEIMIDRPLATFQIDGESGYGALDKPAPIGASGPLGDGWALRVDAVVKDGERAILDENQFNEPAGEGRRFVIVTVTAFNDTGAPGIFFANLRLRLIGGATGAVYMTFDAEHYCGVVPDMLNDQEAAPGATVSGNLCWRVVQDDIDDLLLFSEAYVDEESEIWFSVAP